MYIQQLRVAVLFVLGRIACVAYLRPITSSVHVSWSVCVSDTLVSPAKMTKPIELPFGGVDSDRPKET